MRRLLAACLALATLAVPPAAFAQRPAEDPASPPASGVVAPPSAPAALAPPSAPGAVVTPDVVVPAPVPVQRAPEPPTPADPAPIQRIRLQADPYTTLVTEPPVLDEAAASAEMLAWRDYLQAKKDRRLQRGSEIGGPAALGVRLGSKAQAAQVEGLDEAQRARLLAWNGEGALVVATVPGSPAERAGLLPGDVIVQYAGVWIDGMGLLVNLASRSVIDREQEVWVLRDGAMERLYVTPIDRHEMERP